MTQKNETWRQILCACCIFLCLAAGISLYSGIIRDFDLSIRHFAAGSPHLTVAVVCTVLSILCGVAAGFLCRKQKSATPSTSASSVLFFGYLAAFLLFARFILEVQSVMSAPSGTNVLSVLHMICMIGTAAFLFLSMSARTADGTLYSTLSLVAIVFAILSVLLTYFDGENPMNAELKSWQLMMLLAQALFFTAESRVALRRCVPATYTALAGLCAALSVSYGLAHVPLFFYNPTGYDAALIESLAHLTLGLYAAARMFSCREHPASASNEETPHD